MGASGDPLSHDPHPERLARILLEHGDTDGALRVCEIWKAREPGHPRIADLENEARRGGRPRREIPLTPTLAERYVQQGYLPEALEIYKRLAARMPPLTVALERSGLLEQFLASSPPALSDPLVARAERCIAERRLSSALLDYRELARRAPTNEQVVRRAEQLRSIVLGIPLPGDKVGLAGSGASTAEMPALTQAMLMVREANLAGAAALLRVLAAGKRQDRTMTELAAAVERLVEVVKSPVEGDRGPTTRTTPLPIESIIKLQVRMGNFAQAAEVCRVVVAQQPGNLELRQLLDDAETIADWLNEQDAAETGGDETRTKRKSRKMRAPNPGRVLGKTSSVVELKAFSPPRDGAAGNDEPADQPGPTAIHSKAELAELSLHRGEPEHALALYEELAAESPESRVYRERIVAIRRELAAARAARRKEAEEAAKQETRPPDGTARAETSGPAVVASAVVDALKSVPRPEAAPKASTDDDATMRVRRARQEASSRAAAEAQDRSPAASPVDEMLAPDGRFSTIRTPPPQDVVEIDRSSAFADELKRSTRLPDGLGKALRLPDLFQGDPSVAEGEDDTTHRAQRPDDDDATHRAQRPDDDDTTHRARKPSGFAPSDSPPPRRAARTTEGPPPTVVSADEEGRSVVEIPASISSAIEVGRRPRRLSELAQAAGDHGVLVRPIVLLE